MKQHRITLKLPDDVELAVAFAEANGYAGLREYLELHAQHATSCAHSTVRPISNPPRVFLPCTCGLEQEDEEC
jgi:hypothetical protein